MQPGELDRLITLVSVGGSNTGTGWKSSETTLGKVWASRRDVSDGEKIAAGAVQSLVRSRFVVWSSSVTRALKPKDRLIEGSLRFEILGIKEIGRRELLEITAEARLD